MGTGANRAPATPAVGSAIVTKQTPLHHLHQGLGATFTNFAGWRMPVRYSSDLAEHHAVRNKAGLFDLSHMGQVDVTGPGAGEALDFALVSGIANLAIGKAKYSMLCNSAGGVMDDLIVYRLGEEDFMVVANASNAEVVAAELAHRGSNFSAVIEDAAGTRALLAVQGPEAAHVLGRLTGAALSDLRYYTAHVTEILGNRATIARTGYTGEDGFEVYVAADQAAEVWSALLDAGADRGLVPAGLACRDTLRLEAGMPLYGHELTESITPYDVGAGRIVNLGKEGGFVGRDALIDRADVEPSQRLVGLVGSGRRSPRAGCQVLEADTGRDVGRVTSGAPSPTLGRPIAMAFVDRAVAEPGAELVVVVRGSLEEVMVCQLPFYKRAT